MKKKIIIAILPLIGIVFTALPLFNLGKKLYHDIWIMCKGTRKKGLCTDHFRGSRADFSSLLVEWEGDYGETKRRHYRVLLFRFDFPFEISVYTVDDDLDESNLGLHTVLTDLFYFLMFFAIWVMCSAGTVHWITEIKKYY